MITIITNSLLFLLIIYGNGIIFSKKIFNDFENQNFYEILLIGLVTTTLLSQFINFFFPLNNYLTIINLLVVILYLTFEKQIIKNLRIDYKFFFIFFILILSNIYASDFSEDLNHYHYGMISNSDNLNFIWGYSFFHDMYGTSPIWLTTHSYLNFDNSRLQDIHVLNGLFLFIFLGLFFSEIQKNNQSHSVKQIILFSILLFVLIKFTRLKEFGIDRPAFLLFCTILYIYLKYFFTNSNENILENFSKISLISICIIAIKITYLPIIIFPLFILLRYKRKITIFNTKILLILLAFSIFILKNFLGTGCIIYPVSYSCLDFISWSNSKGAEDLAFLAEYFNKSWTSYEGYLSKLEYIRNFNWFETWFIRGNKEILDLFLTIILVFILSIFIFGIKKRKIFKYQNELSFLKKILSSIIVISLFIYFIKNPVIRMNFHALISILILLIINFVSLDSNQKKLRTINFFLFLAIFFNLSKNFDRIVDKKFINDPIEIISNKITAQKQNNLDDFIYYTGWYGETPISYKILENKMYEKKFIFNVISNK